MIGIGEWAAMGTALAWTLSALAWTASGKRVGSLPVGFIRLLVASVYLATYGRLLRGLWLPSDAPAETWWLLSCSGFLGFFLADLCLFRAFILIGPRLALLVQSLTPPLTALTAWAFLGERLSTLDWLGMVLTVTGVSWVILGRAPSTPARIPSTTITASSRNLRNGLLLSGAAALAQACGFVCSKQGIGQYDAVAATFIRVITAIACFAVLITLTRRWNFIRFAVRDTKAMSIVLFGSLVGPFLGVALSLVAIRNCHTGVAATIISTTPVLILPFVIILHREHVSLRSAVGAVISVIGVALLVL